MSAHLNAGHVVQNLSDTWLSRDSKKAESAVGTAAALNKLNSIKARLRNARSEVYCTLQVCFCPTLQLHCIHFHQSLPVQCTQ